MVKRSTTRQTAATPPVSRLPLLAAGALLAASCAAFVARNAQPALPQPYEPDIPSPIDPPMVRLSDGERTIVLIGTIHFVPSEYADRLLELPAELYDEIDTADLLLVESDLVTLEPIERLLVAFAVSSSYEQADGERGRPSLEQMNGDIVPLLTEMLGEEQQRQAGEIAQLRPWAARMRIDELLRDESEVEWQPGLDDHIAQRARESGVDLEYLEKWEELAELQDSADQKPYVRAVLFALEADVDREMMMRTRSNRELALVERWSRSQLAGPRTNLYDDLGIDVPETVRRAWRQHDALIFDVRERTWAARILDRIEREGVQQLVVAAGAAHLVDDRAILLDLLTEAGFEKTAPVR